MSIPEKKGDAEEMYINEFRIIEQSAGRRSIKGMFQATTLPSPIPKTGAGVTGLASTDDIATGSFLLIETTGDVYILGEDGEWHNLASSE